METVIIYEMETPNVTVIEYCLKLDSHVPKNFALFASIKALKK